MSFPDKEQREKCWKSKDLYWSCLDEVDKGKRKKEDCEELQKLYISSCPGQWVKHFDRKREYEKFKVRLEKEGYEPMNSKK